MLEQLIVKDFALSDKNTLDFHSGMTCITGETGAGGFFPGQQRSAEQNIFRGDGYGDMERAFFRL